MSLIKLSNSSEERLPCRAICPGQPWFSLPVGTSKWARKGVGIQGGDKSVKLRELPDYALPSDSVCEED